MSEMLVTGSSEAAEQLPRCVYFNPGYAYIITDTKNCINDCGHHSWTFTASFATCAFCARQVQGGCFHVW